MAPAVGRPNCSRPRAVQQTTVEVHRNQSVKARGRLGQRILVGTKCGSACSQTNRARPARLHASRPSETSTNHRGVETPALPAQSPLAEIPVRSVRAEYRIGHANPCGCRHRNSIYPLRLIGIHQKPVTLAHLAMNTPCAAAYAPLPSSKNRCGRIKSVSRAHRQPNASDHLTMCHQAVSPGSQMRSAHRHSRTASSQAASKFGSDASRS